MNITKEAKELYRELCVLNNEVAWLESELEEMLWVDNIYEVEWL